MIDLRTKGLPNTVEVAGSFFHIKTDFRIWLQFGEVIKNDFTLKDIEFVFVNKIPQIDFSIELVEFYSNRNATPTASNTASERAIDFILDGEYIVASFMAVYGIDLTSCDMHWHMFKALLIGLPDDSRIKQIMSMRTYKKTTKKQDAIYEENKRAWSLPTEITSEEQMLLDEINEEFYNS